jgi:hypothetical protein
MAVFTMSRRPWLTCGAASQRSGCDADQTSLRDFTPGRGLRAGERPEQARSDAADVTAEAAGMHVGDLLAGYADPGHFRAPG